MAITGIDTIDGKQIIAAGAVSAKSAEMAYNDENGNPITGYQVAGDYYSASNPSGFISEVPDTYLQNTDLTITDGKISEISGVPLSAGSTPAYGYTNNGLISSIDTNGLYATSGSANHLNHDGTMSKNITQSDGVNNFLYMPNTSPWKSPTGIFSPLQYATGACLAMAGGGYAAYFKGNEWYVSNSGIGQMLRGEVHKSRGVHVSGATTAGYGFDLNISGVSGVNSTGSWKYGPAEDAALRAVSSCDMHESAFEYDANDKISAYNGSAFAAQLPEEEEVEFEELDISGISAAIDYISANSTNFYTTANESGFISEVPNTYLQNTDLSTTDGKVTAISGIPLSAGGDVPEGVMVESGLEYNAVNEISAYNGSAIAQYGAEKQWLVHDDTLVHAANSAQYALGVNLSAVAQLLGLDETVLFSGTGATGAFSEPLSAFKKVEFHLSDDTMIRQVATLYPDEAVNGTYIVGAASVWQPNSSPVRVLSVSGNMNEFTKTNASYQWWSKTDGGYSTFSTAPVKVVGIGRKEV